MPPTLVSKCEQQGKEREYKQTNSETSNLPTAERKENSRPERNHSDNKRTTRSKKYSAPQKQYENRARFPHDTEILHLLGVKSTR